MIAPPPPADDPSKIFVLIKSKYFSSSSLTCIVNKQLVMMKDKEMLDKRKTYSQACYHELQL